MRKAVGLLLALASSVCVADVTSLMAPVDATEIADWMGAHKEYRLADIGDCRCRDDVDVLRKGGLPAWKPQPNYHPYYAAGDFDGNGIRDFAVIVVPNNKQEKSRAIVFFRSEPGKETRVMSHPIKSESLEGLGLFVESRKGRSALLLGAFASEGEEIPILTRKKRR